MDETDASKKKSAKIIQLSSASSNKQGTDNKIVSPVPNDNAYLLGLDKVSAEFEGLVADEALTNLEQNSIRALVAYNAYTSGVNEEVIRSMVETRFGAKGISSILRRDYDDVIRYLVDLKANKAVN